MVPPAKMFWSIITEVFTWLPGARRATACGLSVGGAKPSDIAVSNMSTAIAIDEPKVLEATAAHR